MLFNWTFDWSPEILDISQWWAHFRSSYGLLSSSISWMYKTDYHMSKNRFFMKPWWQEPKHGSKSTWSSFIFGWFIIQNFGVSILTTQLLTELRKTLAQRDPDARSNDHQCVKAPHFPWHKFWLEIPGPSKIDKPQKLKHTVVVTDSCPPSVQTCFKTFSSSFGLSIKPKAKKKKIKHVRPLRGRAKGTSHLQHNRLIGSGCYQLP